MARKYFRCSNVAIIGQNPYSHGADSYSAKKANSAELHKTIVTVFRVASDVKKKQNRQGRRRTEGSGMEGGEKNVIFEQRP